MNSVNTLDSSLPVLIKALSFIPLWQSHNDAECPCPWHLCHFRWSHPCTCSPGVLSLFRSGCRRSNLLSVPLCSLWTVDPTMTENKERAEMSLSYSRCFVSSLDLNLHPTVYWINYRFFSWMKRLRTAGFITWRAIPNPQKSQTAAHNKFNGNMDNVFLLKWLIWWDMKNRILTGIITCLSLDIKLNIYAIYLHHFIHKTAEISSKSLHNNNKEINYIHTYETWRSHILAHIFSLERTNNL